MDTTRITPQPLSRIPENEGSLCDQCTAKCCRYFALPIDTPKTPRDFDNMRWFLLHDRATVYTESDDWYLLVQTTCRHLQTDNRCGIYDTRPQVCREYDTKDCEFDDSWVYDRYFETPEQVQEYAEAVLPRRNGQSLRTPRPPLLPLLAGGSLPDSHQEPRG